MRLWQQGRVLAFDPGAGRDSVSILAALGMSATLFTAIFIFTSARRRGDQSTDASLLRGCAVIARHLPEVLCHTSSLVQSHVRN
jgi:hypothetical protein